MTDDARTAVLEQLTAASVEFDAVAREYAAVGMLDEAEAAHECAQTVNRFYIVESENPKPKPPCDCQRCSALYAAGGSR
jgi:hypothetical protein